MRSPKLSRREFLKLASLSLFSVVAAPTLRRFTLFCPTLSSSSSGLSAEQKQRLLEASRTFIAPDFESARQVALQIDFIEGPNEDASTMCGPLSVAILQAAGLLGAWVKGHDFWLADPSSNVQTFSDTFPESLYIWKQSDQPIAEFDFAKEPLQAGDVVYLHANPGDTYEHVFVVNRIDEDGRAYTVTNLFVTTGTIIDETMLYDPKQPGVGQLADWGNRSLRNKIGNTGRGGFNLWRVKDGRSLEFPADENSVQLRKRLDTLLRRANGDWYAAIKHVDGPLLYQFNPYASFHPASTIKVPVAMGFYQWLEDEGVSDWPAYLEEHGADGRSYAALLKAMLVDSEEEATETLVDSLGRAWLEEAWDGWGLKATHIDPRRSSATEILGLLEDLYTGRRLTARSNEAILSYMSTYTSNDATRIGLLRPRLPRGSIIYNKRGSLVDWPRVVADSAIIKLPDSACLFTMHGLGRGQATYESLEATLASAVQIFGDFLSAR